MESNDESTLLRKLRSSNISEATPDSASITARTALDHRINLPLRVTGRRLMILALLL